MFEIRDQLIKVNYSKGRLQKVSMVVIHLMEGDLPNLIGDPYDWFNNPAAKASAHYGITREEGPIRRWVREEDTAWANGRVDRPTARQVIDNSLMNPNSYSVSIENEGWPSQMPTEFQMQANAWLTANIARRHGFPPNRYHVVGHNEIFKGKSCPGHINVETISRMATIKIAGSVIVSMPPKVPVGTRVWSDYFREYLIVTDYKHDHDWTFITESGLRQLGQRAQTPFSQMPKESPYI